MSIKIRLTAVRESTKFIWLVRYQWFWYMVERTCGTDEFEPAVAQIASNNNNKNNLPLIWNRSTLHTVYNIQQSATQGSNDMAHRLSCRTTVTIRFNPEGGGCQK